MPRAKLVEMTLPAFLGVWLCLSAPVCAQMEAPSPLDIFLARVQDVCGTAPQAERFVQALRVELATASFTAPDLATTGARLCDAERGVVTVQMSGRDVTLDVSDVPYAARPRTLAVAFAETLRMPAPPPASPELPTPKPPPPASPSLAASAPQHEEPRTTVVEPDLTSGIQLPVSIGALILGPEQTVAVGANVGVSFPATQSLRLGVQIGYLTAHHRSAFGEARLHAGNVEGNIALTVVRPSAHSTIDVGTSASAHRAFVVVDSAWGIAEPKVNAWFALWNLHVGVSTLLADRIAVFTRLGGVKDLRGLSLSAGGAKAMSFYGFGAELRLGAGYTW